MTTHILTKEQRKENKTRTFVKVLNTLPLEMVLDWLYRGYYSILDEDPLSLKRYLEEVKQVEKATCRMKEIGKKIDNLSLEDSERRQRVIAAQRVPFLKELEGMV